MEVAGGQVHPTLLWGYSAQKAEKTIWLHLLDSGRGQTVWEEAVLKEAI